MVFPVLVAVSAGLQAFELAPEVGRLKNGLQFVLVEDRRRALVSVQLWYRVGWADDVPGKPGLCDLARSVLDSRGKPAVGPRGPCRAQLSRTLPDACYFASVSPPGDLDRLLKLEADRLRFQSVTADELEAAQAAADRQSDLDSCSTAWSDAFGVWEDSAIYRRLLTAAFPDHPYRHLSTLPPDVAQSIGPPDVDEFLRTWFVPANATVVVVGNVQAPTARDLIASHFDSLPWSEPPPRPRSARPKPQTVRLDPVAADRRGLDLAWVTRGLGADENLAARVLMHHLCNPVDGPVYLRLIEAGCLPPRWSQQAWQLGGMLVLSVDLPEGVSVDPEQVVREELEQTAREVRSETSFDRARALAVREVRNRQSDFGCYALSLGLHEVVAGDLRLSEWQVLRMQRLTARELQEAADELLHGRMICLPRVAGGGKIGAAEPGELSTGAESSPPGATSLPVRPEAEVGFPAAEWREELIGRVRLRVCPTPGLELAEVRTLIGLDPNPVPALDALMAVGSVDRSVDQIRDYLSLWGLDLLPVAGLHGVGLVGRGPASRAAQMIELQAELLRRPNRTSSACHAAVQSVRRLQAWIDQIPCGRQQDWYVPPGLVGWRAGASFMLDAAWVKRNLSALDAIREVEIQVVGDVDSKKTAEIAGLLWADWQPTAQTVSPSPSQPGHSE